MADKPKGANLEKLGKRKIEEGELDPLLQAEAIKMSRWAHHDALLGARAALGMSDDEELTHEQVSLIKQAVFNNKYQYLCDKEESTDPY